MTTAPPSGEATRELRREFLTQPPSTWGIRQTPDNPDVFAVLMEWLIDDVAVTVAVAVDGTASVYTTSGMGMIGGDSDEVANREARALVEAAAGFLDEATPVSEFPYPRADRVQFYLRTFQGVRLLDAARESVVDGHDRYSRLHEHGWAVFERLLVLAGHLPAHLASPVNEKEWFGPEGYVNCLLTSMSRGVGRSIVISTGEPVPDLVALAAGNESLRGWLEAQEFPYESMEAKAVVRAIRKTAHMEIGLPFLTRHGEIHAVHATEDGDALACVFDVEIAPFDRSAKIHMAPSRDRRVRELQGEANAMKKAVDG
jgi:hypothetical protein